jgi:hypothetical protein
MLSQIQRATEEKLGLSAGVYAIACPEHYKSTPYMTTLSLTAIEACPDIKDIMQVGSHLDYTRLAYGLNTTRALNYSGDRLDEVNALLLYVDYNKGFIDVTIMQVFERFSGRERAFRIDNFGGSGNNASVRILRSP